MLTDKYTTVIANLLAGNQEYIPNYLYVEFTNSTVSIPEDQTSSSYYNSLADPIGYLRIPITIKPTVSRDNKVTYTVLATMDTSVNGVTFGNDSVIYGVALVAAPDPTDPAEDIVIAREYFTDPSKQLVLTSNQTFCFSFQLAIFDSSQSDPEEEYWNED